jgi:multimeric flavodoxin WrbA
VNITIINGSPRKNGSTFRILDYFKESLKNNNSDKNISFINLIDYNLKYCIGCQNCYKTGKCIILDDRIEEIHDTIKNSDGLIIGSPNYATNVSGLYKNFYDRVHMTMEQLLYKKPCINIITYENLKILGKTALNIMQDMVKHAGGYVTNSMAIKTPFNKDPLDRINKLRIEKASIELIKKIQKNKPPLFSKIFTKIVINIGLKPFVYKNKEHNMGIINSWTEKKLVGVASPNFI